MFFKLLLSNWSKIIQTSQVGGVLETSGPPLDDGHRDFYVGQGRLGVGSMSPKIFLSKNIITKNFSKKILLPKNFLKKNIYFAKNSNR